MSKERIDCTSYFLNLYHKISLHFHVERYFPDEIFFTIIRRAFLKMIFKRGNLIFRKKYNKWRKLSYNNSIDFSEMVIKGYAWFKEQWGVLTFKDSLFSNVLYEWVFLDHKSHKTIRQAQLQGFRIKIWIAPLIFSNVKMSHDRFGSRATRYLSMIAWTFLCANSRIMKIRSQFRTGKLR